MTDEIRTLLQTSKTIAIVGLSSDPFRPSFGVSKYMQSQGYRIIPVNPKETEVLGEKAYAKLDDVPDEIDIVNIFRRPAAALDVVESAIAKGAKAVWMQEGVINQAAFNRAKEAGLVAVMDQCILKEHRRL